jgi:tRNA A37 threonylcarbamoyladenosine biosynthesis protein TsaE
MKKEGITIINGGYASGKTLLTLSIIKAFLMVSRQFKEQIE